MSRILIIDINHVWNCGMTEQINEVVLTLWCHISRVLLWGCNLLHRCLAPLLISLTFILPLFLSLSLWPTTHTNTSSPNAPPPPQMNASFDCYLSHGNTLNPSPDAVTQRYASTGVAQSHPGNSALLSG